MKLLHTSDWHVGKTLRSRDRSEEFEAVLAEIAGIARAEAVDATIVAGDLFETAAPTPEAERIVYRALLDLAEVAPVVILSGNHDNERRLQAVEPLLGLGRVVTRATLARAEDGGIWEARTGGGETLLVAMVPFLSQRYIVRADDLMALDADEHAGMYAARVRGILQRLTGSFRDDTVNVIAAHLMAAGGQLGGGERLAHTIFEYCVDPSVFPSNTHYVALGHLHRAQQVSAQPPAWYSGSPLQLDFGETEDAKCVLVVEATASTPAEVRRVPLAAGRRLRKVIGTLEELEALAGTTGEDYLQVLVREPARPGLSQEVRELLGDLAMDIKVVSPELERAQARADASRSGRTPRELFTDYLNERGAMDDRVLALFDRLMDEAHATPAP